MVFHLYRVQFILKLYRSFLFHRVVIFIILIFKFELFRAENPNFKQDYQQFHNHRIFLIYFYIL